MICLQLATKDQKPIVLNLMYLYQHDMSEYDRSLPDSSGQYLPDRYFDLYWEENDRYPYLILEEEKPIGFALIRMLDTARYSVAEFFIVRSARGTGRGSAAAKMLFDSHPGSWQVAELECNKAAQAFWRSVISSYTDGAFEESWSESSPIGPKQTFETPTQQGAQPDAFGAG